MLELHQIFHSAKQHGQYIRLYEEISPSSSTQGLIPWLLLNYKISFISDQKKDLYYPIGFNLITGQILTHFDTVLTQVQLTPKIPDYHFTLRPIYSLSSATQHIEQHLRSFLAEQDQSWADEANQRLDEEIELMKSFFDSTSEEDMLLLEKKREEIDRYRPKIEVSPINVGIIYLQTKLTETSSKHDSMKQT
ncbi:YqhG family protein [Caldalkalibacillus mannanilyticus]|uniref:YqhG family protein n=1 Tax=Caldalkalibacillus mannanilyticus TaxID=1418 RepID=UPI0009DD2994|nr:YqhG family protein [Caldalkalibacillus mannanilyticus]